jgi:hypothetical protein
MEILKGCSNLVLSGDQHIGVVVSYDEYEITDCASPAALNTVWWRLNENEVGASHVDLHGNQYTLHGVWNVDPELAKNASSPHSTINQSATVKQKRADGFLMVVIDGNHATCSARSYQKEDAAIWSHTATIRSIQ